VINSLWSCLTFFLNFWAMVRMLAPNPYTFVNKESKDYFEAQEGVARVREAVAEWIRTPKIHRKSYPHCESDPQAIDNR